MNQDKLLQELTKIAEKNIYTLRGRGDLESRNADWQDFSQTVIWELKDALIEAYELGKKAGTK